MAQIYIPEDVFPGFIEIAKLPEAKAKQFASFLGNVTIGINFENFLSEIDDYLFFELKIKSSKRIVETIISFGDLIEKEDFNAEITATALAESFKDLSKEDLNPKEFKSLKSNLFLILSNSQNLKLTLKALELAHESENVFRESKIITDIRLIFNENLNDKDRNSIILHRLHISFRKNKRPDDIYMTMDLNDLHDLREIIDRAIKKEEVIREDYKHLKFV
ncbi:MAG: hypothetical protein JWQ09_1011 [Segetibacter sp.]|nr:hypothetical protein [Segetibacter sp.]